MNISDRTQVYLNYLQDKFDKEHFKEFINDLLNLENEDIIDTSEQTATSEQYKNYIKTSQLYAKYQDNKRANIGVILLKIDDRKNPANARTMQRNYISHLMDHYSLDCCLTAIYSDISDNWRLSFVKKEIAIIEGKIKDTLSSAKRYSYLFGKNEPNHTAKKQLLSLLEDNIKKYSAEEIEEKFSVEKVTKEFFENYKENYLLVKENLESNPEFVAEATRCKFSSEEFTKKLMGQIVFLYFLQKKGWLGVHLVPSKIELAEYNEIKKNIDVIQQKILDSYYTNFEGYKKIINSKLEKVKENEEELAILSDIFVNSKYDCNWGSGETLFIRRIFNNCINRNKEFFDDYLEPFFYEGLNYRRKNQYFGLFNCKIPFLNGGLFEPLDNYNWKMANFGIDNKIFSNDEKTGILDFFDTYNFTINEEEPLEKEIAVDPEMLGKIFENLLDVKDRKSKGAFYTPREVVHYMCQESLANFLVKKVGVDYNEIKTFIQYGELLRDEDLKSATKDQYKIGKTVFENITKIDVALKNMKIADPSVGSGAFPLGMLNEIVKLRDNITSYMLIYNKLGLFGTEYSENQIKNKRSIYNIKWDTIRNSIYAVDLENSAVDITKLRLWLSIIVDQNDVPASGPEPLPNLDCKIMQGNTLVDEFNGIKLLDDELLDQMKNDYKYRESKKNKKQLTFAYEDDLQMQLFDDSDEKKSVINDLINLKTKLYSTNDSKIKKELLNGINKKRIELFEMSFKYSKEKLNELLEIDNSHNKPYFSWKLEFIEVFVENDGFDIVIGNPPYIGESGNKEIFRSVAITDFGKKYYIGKMDFWYFFTSKGIELLKESGIISYIAPNNWVTTSGGKNMRNHILNDTKLISFIDFKDFMVFDSADQQTMIYIIEKTKENDNYSFEYNEMNSDENIEIKENVLRNFFNKQIGLHYYCKMIKEENIGKTFHFLNQENQKLINKIIENGNYYIDAKNDMAQGIVFPQDKLNKKSTEILGNGYEIGQGVFVLSQDELNNLNFTEDEKAIIKNYYTSEEIHRWSICKDNQYYVIYTNKDTVKNIDNYPNIQKHLDQFKEIITSDNKPYGLHRARDNKFFTGEKIISIRKCVLPTFSYSDFDTYVSQTFNVIKPQNIDVKYLLGILNSKVVAYWLKNKGKMQGTHYQVDAEPLSEIPICINNNYTNELIAEVDKILNGQEDENYLNDIVYKIYGLNDDEKIIIENSIICEGE